MKQSTSNDPNIILASLLEEGEFAFDEDGDLVWRPDPSREWATVSIGDGRVILDNPDIGAVTVACTEDLEEYYAMGCVHVWDAIGDDALKVLERINEYFLACPTAELGIGLDMSMRQILNALQVLERHRLIEKVDAFGRFVEAWTTTWKGKRLLMEFNSKEESKDD